MTLAFGDKLAGGDIFEVRHKEQHRSPGGLVDSVLTRPRRPPGMTRRPGARGHDCWPPPTDSRVALPGQTLDHWTRLSRQGTFPARSDQLVLGDAVRQPLAP